MPAPGPQELGRGVVVASGAAPPGAWRDCPRLSIDAGTVADPGNAIPTLQQAWLDRQPVVVELAVDAQALQARERCDQPVYELTPRFEFELERLHFLVWANTYDARNGVPIWWHGRKAVRRFARQGLRESGPADVELADGTPIYVDGGPFAAPPLSDGAKVLHRWNAEAGSLAESGNHPPEADLAPDQLAAVGHERGGARVIAPAGSGKTRVLTERLRFLVGGRGADPLTVTAVAYNRKAANELTERAGDLVAPNGPSIRTLNSLGLWICNEFGGQGRLGVLEERDVRDLVQEVFEVRHLANTDSVAPYIDGLSAIRLGLSAPTAVEEQIPDAQGLAAGFDRYRSTLAERGVVDFDEQIYRSIEILLRDPDARGAAQARCRHLLVDEFQDLNPAHMLLLRLLCAPAYSCFGVGDDDQVIYGYAGASPEYLIRFDQYFPGAHEYALEVNYRCPPAVVRAASSVLSYNASRIVKTIRTPADRLDDASTDPLLAGRGAVAVVKVRAEELATAATEAISDWKNSGVALDEIAVLTRVNSSLLPVQIALAEAGIPCNTPLDRRALQRTGVKSALAYMRMGLDLSTLRRDDVLQTIRRPSRGIARNVVEMATKRPTTSVRDLRGLAKALSGRDVPKLLTYADDIERVGTACRSSTSEGLRAIRVEVGLGDTMDVLDSSRGEADRSTHADDLVALEAVASLHPDAGSFESWLSELLGKRSTGGGAAVHLSTIHKIKGREWEHVIVYGASKGLLPHRLSDDEEGERRVFHVALTRAIRQVVVLADVDEPSPFVDELNGSRARGPIESSRTLLRTRTGRATGVGSPSGDRKGAGGQGVRSRQRATTRVATTVPTVQAEIGLVVEYGGHTGDVVDFNDSGAVLQVGEARLKVRYGTEVRVRAATVVLARPGHSEGPDSESAEYERALRAWRADAAKRAAVPAYVVLNDSELTGIAADKPTTLAELALCKGIGPARLERWGDELLAALNATGTE